MILHPDAFISGYALTERDALRFWEKVTALGPDECWPWQASLHRLGYGSFRVGGKYGKIVEAHRVAHALAFGRFEGQVLHRCDNRACCNPAHTFLGDHASNMADCAAKGRNRGPRLGNGYQKISARQSIAIYRAVKHGSNFSELAREYGVTPPTIREHFTKQEQARDGRI